MIELTERLRALHRAGALQLEDVLVAIERTPEPLGWLAGYLEGMAGVREQLLGERLGAKVKPPPEPAAPTPDVSWRVRQDAEPPPAKSAAESLDEPRFHCGRRRKRVTVDECLECFRDSHARATLRGRRAADERPSYKRRPKGAGPGYACKSGAIERFKFAHGHAPSSRELDLELRRAAGYVSDPREGPNVPLSEVGTGIVLEF